MGEDGSSTGTARVDAVGFDLDYTLAVPDRERSAILLDALDAVGVPRDALDEPRDAYLRAHARHLDRETREPVFESLLSGAGVETEVADGSGVDPAAAARHYRDGIAAALRPVPGARDLLDRLRETYRVGLLTDGPAVAQRDKLAALGWENAFDAVLVSGELGVGKPDRRAFAALCAALRADPEHVVYVGDDPARDVVGAADAGLRTVQVLGPDDDAHERADATVSRDEMASRLPAVLAEFAGGGRE